MSEFNIEEAVGWAGLRAMREAMDNAPTLPDTEDVFVEVIIRVNSETWPGKGPGGRSRSRQIGYASCLYRGRNEGGQA